MVNFFGRGNQKTKNKQKTQKNQTKNKCKKTKPKPKQIRKTKGNKLEKFNRYTTCSSQILYRIVSFYFLILFIYHINWKENVLINLKLEKPIKILII